MKTSVICFLAFVVIFSVTLTSCGEDDPEVQTYQIKVTNITSQDVEIFISSNGGNSFSTKGTIPSGEFREFQMTLNVSYIVRASRSGSANDFVQEIQVSNDNPDILSLNYDITN